MILSDVDECGGRIKPELKRTLGLMQAILLRSTGLILGAGIYCSVILYGSIKFISIQLHIN